MVTVNLYLNPTYTADENTDVDTTICEADLPFSYEGTVFTAEGSKDITFQTVNGCDSVVTVNLYLNPTYTADENTDVDTTICEADLPFSYEGTVFTAEGSKDITFQTVNGCDSVVTVNLHVLENSYTVIDTMVCDSLVLNGETFYTTGTKIQTFTNQAGCDSILTINLFVLLSDTITIDTTTCDELVVNDSTYTKTGVYEQYLSNDYGCSSTLIINATILKSTEHTIDTTVCYEYTLNDFTYYESGQYIQHLDNLAGCDSIITLNLIVQDTTPPEIACPGNLELLCSDNIMDSISNWLSSASAIDNCDAEVEIVNDFDINQLPVNCTENPIVVTFVAFDDYNNSDTCQASIRIIDDTAPVIECDTLFVYLNEDGTYVLNSSDIDKLRANVTDNCTNNEDLDIEVTQRSFQCINIGDEVYTTVIATDACGNEARCDAPVVVLDTIAPEALCKDITVYLDENGEVTIYANQLNNTEDIESVPSWGNTFNNEEGGSYDACGISGIYINRNYFDCGDVGKNIVTLTVYDIHGNSSTCESTVTVDEGDAICFNVPPVAVNDINTTQINTPVDGNVLTNDFDPDGGLLTVNTSPVISPSNGTVTLNADGTYVYTPDDGFTGNDSFDYQVCDPSGLCDTATVYISVFGKTDGNNRPPVAVEDNYTGSVSTPVYGNLLTNDYDPDGDNFTINTTPVTPPAIGSLTINNDGTFTYIPVNGFTGTVTFEYQICDDNTPALCDIAIVTIDIRDIPGKSNTTVGVDDAYYTTVNEVVSGNVSDNDYDPEGDEQIRFTLVSGPQNGTLTLNNNGTFEYTPDENFSGNDRFVYEVCDKGTPVACDFATAYIVVEDTNQPPVAVNDINTTQINTPVDGNVLTNDFDPDGGLLTVNTSPVISPSNGTVTLNADGTYVYTPDDGFTGNDSFDYQVCDPSGLCDTATVYISVFGKTDGNNRPPVAVEDNYTGSVSTPVYGNLLTNDYDPDGDNFTINTTPVTPPAIGSLTINNDGTFTYIPVNGFTGTVTFEYQICDDNTPALCDIAIVTIDIRDIPGKSNTTVGVDDAYYTTVNEVVSGNVSDNDYDPEGDEQVRFTLVSGPQNGTLTLNNNGTFEYTPDENFSGNDRFVYEVCDKGTPVACDFATAYIVVEDTNQPPVAVNDINTTQINTPVDGNVLTNDFDPDGGLLTVNTSPVISPSNGTVTLNADGTYVYTPDDGFTGNDSFDYQVCDPSGLCDTATVYISVFGKTDGNNRPPVAVEDNYTGSVSTPVYGNLLTNDYDPDGDNFTINTTPVTPPAIGSLTINNDGTFTYIPVNGFTGTVTFEYQICDDNTPALCDIAIVTIDIRDIPGKSNTTVGVDDAYYTTVNEVVSGNVSDNDYDPEGDEQVRFTLVSGPQNGTLTLNNNGTFEYTPDENFSGNDRFVYEVCDNGTPVACDFATAYIVVEHSNRPPVAVNDTIAVGNCSGEVTFDVLLNDYDPDNNVLTSPSIVSNVSDGTLTLNEDGTFTYDAIDGYEGTVQFTYQICDSENPDIAECDEAIVTIYVLLDTDCDGVPNNDDIDDDNDGILDVDETFTADNDGDGIPNYLDIDSDGDGIIDNIEAQAEGTYRPPLWSDSDGDGWDDRYDPDSGGTYFELADTDGDGDPDFIDLDTDADGVDDYIEGFDVEDANGVIDSIPDTFPAGIDSDHDGLDDNYDNIDGWGNIQNPIGGNAPLPDYDEDGIRAWRDNDDKPQGGNDNPVTGCELLIPNGFSPNNDNVNDYFEIVFNCEVGEQSFVDVYQNAKLYIYNRWGNLLYEKENYGNTDVWGNTDAWWNGYSENALTIGGGKVPSGTYVYILMLGDGQVYKGTVFVNY